MKQQRSGFSLIELIIVIATLSLFFGFSLASYNSFNETKKLEADAREFIETLELAKTKATVGEKPDDLCVLQSFTVTYDNSSNQYSMNAQCPTDQTIVSSKTLSNGGAFQSAGSAIFYPLNKPATFSSSCVLIKNTHTNKCRQITLDSPGIISETQNDTCICQ